MTDKERETLKAHATRLRIHRQENCSSVVAVRNALEDVIALLLKEAKQSQSIDMEGVS